MAVIDCGAIRESVFQYLQAETEVFSTKQVCMLSLPIKVLDGANAEVFLEEVNNGAFLVHDGGTTLGHLESSGLMTSESRVTLLEDLARRLGVAFTDGTFKGIAKGDAVHKVALAVAQCCSMAMFDLLKHVPFSEEEQLRARVSTEVNHWSTSSGIRVDSGVKRSGIVRKYTIDFIARSKTPIEVSLLIPSYSATVSADRYGLQVLDLKTTNESAVVKRLAVLAKPEKWTRPARRIISKLADQVAEVSVGETLLPTGITEALYSLSMAA